MYINTAERTQHAINTTIVELASLLRPVSQKGQSLDTYKVGASRVGWRLRVRVDWDGRDANPGTFEFLSDSGWIPCANLSTTSAAQDLILVELGPRQEAIEVILERGPLYSARKFQYRKLSIDWRSGRLPGMDAASSFTPWRGTHYDYRQGAGVDDVSWQDAALHNGVYRGTLRVEPGESIELWTHLLHPVDDDKWCPQDPIVRTGNGSGS